MIIHLNYMKGKETKTIGAKHVFAWIFSVLFIVGGIGMFVESFLSGFLVLLAGIIILPPFNKILEEKAKLKITTWLKVIIVFVLLVFAGMAMPNENPENSGVSSDINTLSTEQQIQQDVQKILGSDKIKDLTYYEGAGLLIINYKASDYSSEITLQNDHIRIYEKIFENYDAEDISIFSWMIFIDTYGQEKEMVGVRSSTTKATANKINWNNLITDNLPKVADTYYIHPALID